MDNFYIPALLESDFDTLIAAAGGVRAHVNASGRTSPSADYRLREALIELKLLDDEGLTKPERQTKLAELFLEHNSDRPVIVLDRESLSSADKKRYDHILEGPIKTAVAKARKQLAQSRRELTDTTASVLLIVNNGYTALDHDALAKLIAHRIRQDTHQIDGVVVAGCYFYSDGFDSFFIWPMTYVPISPRNAFPSYDALKDAWDDLAGDYMTKLMRGTLHLDPAKGAVVDTQFTYKDVTFVKPAPPMGQKSDFYVNGRPRKNSSGIDVCPVVGLVVPGLSRHEWRLVRAMISEAAGPLESYESWLKHRADAFASSKPLKPLVTQPVTAVDWDKWCVAQKVEPTFGSLNSYSLELFNTRITALQRSARERTQTFVLRRYVLAVTEEIGQDKVNDVSHIAILAEQPKGDPMIRPLIENARIFHEHAVALACAYALAENVGAVLWTKDRRYSWT